MRFSKLNLFAFLAFLFAWNSQAIEIIIKDQDGNLLSDAAVWLEGEKYKPESGLSPDMFSMGQKDRTFTPHILIIPQGAKVEFPNFDSILHHVYSFSKPRPFELKLYRDTPKSEIAFENEGVVELGCNIHDWMLGYIIVVNSSHYAVTNSQGLANIDVAPDLLGSVTLNVWHERFEKLEQSEQLTIVLKTSSQKLTYTIKQVLMESFYIEADEMDGYE
jgi:plastocyanin